MFRAILLMLLDIIIIILLSLGKVCMKSNSKVKYAKLPDHDATKMSPCITMCLRFLTSLKQLLSIRIFLIITCISLMVSVFWMQFVENTNLVIDNETLVTEALENVGRNHRYAEVYRKVERLQKDMKYILLWTPYDFAPFYYFRHGQRGFIDKNCSMINCYVTNDKNFFNGDTTNFDAIAFNGRNLDIYRKFHLPLKRSQRQKFIYFNMESADNYPVCSDYFDNYFNWTATYRLDSDIPFPYIQIKNADGEIVGPKKKMNWVVDKPLDEDVEMRLLNKTKAVAWFVSHCKSRSGREGYALQLQKALKPYGLTVDIYGACGPLKCPRDRKESCDSILETDYYFYLSFENSFVEDYVTEKLLTALQHDSVPIVFGGADYSRFLPPGTYLNARNTRPNELAAIIVDLINHYDRYSNFFRWKSSYTYYDPSTTDNVCAVCEALNNKDMFETPSVYRNFRSWWLPNYKDRCKKP